MPKVSVVLTSYNHASFIGESIESVLNQTFSDFELYIIDDCSSDNSWEIIQDYAKKDSRIIPIRHEKNLGGSIKPDLITKLKGKYFCIAHCDDRWHLTKLEKQVEYMDTHPKIGACFTWVEYIDENSEIITNIDNKYTDFNLENRSRFAWLNHFFYQGNCLCHPSVMLRTRIQRNEELYSQGLGALPDLNRWIKLCLKHEIYLYPEKLTCFRIRNNALNTSGNNLANLTRCQFDTLQILTNYLNIDQKSDFLTIFPEANQYLIDNKIILKYALARLCIDQVSSPPYILFGLQIIYNLLQHSKTRILLQNLYHYTSKNFIQETGSHDLFNLDSSAQVLHTTLFFDTGNGFREEDQLSQTVFMKDHHFDLYFNNLPANITKLRFDPDEGKFRKFKDIHIYINDQNIKYQTHASFEADGWINFLTTDPQFYFTFHDKINNVHITGTTETITGDLSNQMPHHSNSELLISLQKIFSKLKHHLQRS